MLYRNAIYIYIFINCHCVYLYDYKFDEYILSNRGECLIGSLQTFQINAKHLHTI